MIKKMFRSLRLFSRRNRYRSIVALTKVESRSGFVLDLGGGPASFFSAMFPCPERVILIDVDYDMVRQAQKRTSAHTLVADGERLPLADRSIDTIICNSVLEHVDQPEIVASEIRRVGRNYFVQVPNVGFPVETHSFIPIPLYSSVPWLGLRQLLCRVFGASFEYLSSVSYLAEPRLRCLFPDATIGYERVFGLIKSFYVHRLQENKQ